MTPDPTETDRETDRQTDRQTDRRWREETHIWQISHISSSRTSISISSSISISISISISRWQGEGTMMDRLGMGEWGRRMGGRGWAPGHM